ncbi:hypothetical protein [Ramlibacter sp.]|uniref:hypothetical protein n=1 Tax=Ramlibacter sp. TaxID=1917967 RepID=UPI003D0BD6BB
MKRFFFWAGLLLLALGASTLRAADADPQAVIEQAGKEFAAIKSSAEDASGKLGSALDGLEELERRLNLADTKKMLTEDQRSALRETIEKSRSQIKRSKRALDEFHSKASVVTDAFDAYEAMETFRRQYQSYQSEQGQLAANLYALGTAMEKYGKNVPLLGDMIEAYGQITTGMLSKIAAVSWLVCRRIAQDCEKCDSGDRTGKVETTSSPSTKRKGALL